MTKNKCELYNEERETTFNRSMRITPLQDFWPEIRKFLEDCLNEVDIEEEIVKKMVLASEELYVNISKYAYEDKIGEVDIKIEYSDIEGKISIIFLDSGKKFDPTKNIKPDFRDHLVSNQEGGRGIFIAKEMCDLMEYKRIRGKNVLTISKKL